MPRVDERGQTVWEKPKVLMHLCSYPGCTAWGCFGINVRLLDGKAGQWACRTHRDWLYTFSTTIRQDAPTPTAGAPDASRPDETGDLLV